MDLSRRAHEDVSEFLVNNDNRAELTREEQAIAARMGSIAAHKRMQGVYANSGLHEIHEELAETLGHRWVRSKYSFHDRHYYNNVTRPMRLGSRIIGLDWQPSEYRPAPIRSLVGDVTFYRTSADEPYIENGFFTALITMPAGDEPRPPQLVYGDLDAARWPGEGSKLLIEDIFGTRTPENRDGRREYSSSNVRDEILLHDLSVRLYEEKWARFANSLFGVATTGRFRKRQIPGVFLQNAQAFAETVTDPTVMTRIRESAQTFIDSYAKPTQTREDIREQAQQQVELARYFHQADSLAINTFDVAKAVVKGNTGKELKQPVYQSPVLDSELVWESMLSDSEEFPLWNRLRSELLERERAAGRVDDSMASLWVFDDYFNRDLSNELRNTFNAQLKDLGGLALARAVYDDPELT